MAHLSFDIVSVFLGSQDWLPIGNPNGSVEISGLLCQSKPPNETDYLHCALKHRIIELSCRGAANLTVDITA